MAGWLPLHLQHLVLFIPRNMELGEARHIHTPGVCGYMQDVQQQEYTKLTNEDMKALLLITNPSMSHAGSTYLVLAVWGNLLPIPFEVSASLHQ